MRVDWRSKWGNMSVQWRGCIIRRAKVTPRGRISHRNLTEVACHYHRTMTSIGKKITTSHDFDKIPWWSFDSEVLIVHTWSAAMINKRLYQSFSRIARANRVFSTLSEIPIIFRLLSPNAICQQSPHNVTVCCSLTVQYCDFLGTLCIWPKGAKTSSIDEFHNITFWTGVLVVKNGKEATNFIVEHEKEAWWCWLVVTTEPEMNPWWASLPEILTLWTSDGTEAWGGRTIWQEHVPHILHVSYDDMNKLVARYAWVCTIYAYRSNWLHVLMIHWVISSKGGSDIVIHVVVNVR